MDLGVDWLCLVVCLVWTGCVWWCVSYGLGMDLGVDWVCLVVCFVWTGCVWWCVWYGLGMDLGVDWVCLVWTGFGLGLLCGVFGMD
jgi:hypothetical protein